MEVRDQPRDGSCSNDSDIKCFWRRIWRLHIPNKVKHFAWIACKNILPTWTNLKRRGIIEDDTCEAYGTDTESTGHVFWSCPFSSIIWDNVAIFGDGSRLHFLEFMDLMWYLVFSKQVSDDILALFVAISWTLWTNRNEKRHGGKPKPNWAVVQWSVQYIREFQEVNVAAMLKLPMLCSVWAPPVSPLYKVNVDGAIFFRVVIYSYVLC